MNKLPVMLKGSNFMEVEGVNVGLFSSSVPQPVYAVVDSPLFRIVQRLSKRFCTYSKLAFSGPTENILQR